MNENIDLTKILKDCPKGTKLYSSICGEVELYEIDNNEDYPIGITNNRGSQIWLTSDGRFLKIFNGECILFPSKDQRDWEKFIPFKDGDVLSYKSTFLKNRTIYIYKYNRLMNTTYYVALSGDTDSTFRISNKVEQALNGYNSTARFATEEEKQKLFQAIKDNGYKWNAETKTLEKLVKLRFKVGDKIVNIPRKYMGASRTHIISEITDGKYICTDCSYISISDQDSWELVPDRFDPKTLKPFDKVLVRDHCNSTWLCRFFSHIMNLPKFYKYATTDSFYKYCIPYNDDTKHLVGTTEEAPEFYKYWED